jgi:hypothetical protein
MAKAPLRFSREEISSFRLQIWESINALLVSSRSKSKETSTGDATFWVLGTEGPTEADATVFAFICSALVCSAYVSLKTVLISVLIGRLSAPESRKVVKSFPVLGDYARRIHHRYFPDYDLWE